MAWASRTWARKRRLALNFLSCACALAKGAVGAATRNQSCCKQSSADRRSPGDTFSKARMKSLAVSETPSQYGRGKLNSPDLICANRRALFSS